MNERLFEQIYREANRKFTREEEIQQVLKMFNKRGDGEQARSYLEHIGGLSQREISDLLHSQEEGWRKFQDRWQ